MSGLVARSVPAPGQAPLVAPNAAALLRRNADEYGDRGRDQVRRPDVDPRRVLRRVVPVRGAVPRAAARRRAASRRGAARQHARLPLRVRRRRARSAARSSVSTTPARRAPRCATSQHTHCGLVLTEPRHEALLAPIAERAAAGARRRPGSPTTTIRAPTSGRSLADALAAHDGATDPGLEPDVDSIWALIFTSGTSDAPKAVICSQRRLLVTGKRMAMIMDLGPDDIGYVCMPLFHSNAVQVGWAPSLVVPCAVGLGRRFSASRLARRHPPLRLDLLQLHRQAARVPARAARARRRRRQHAARRVRQRGIARSRRASSRGASACEVIDAYGATEGGVAVNREPDMPAGALGLAPEHVQVVDDDGNEKPRAELDERGRRAERRGVRRRDRQHPGRRAVRGLLQQRRTRPRRRPATAGTGRATSATRTPTTISTSPGATPTGSASTARTFPPARSRRRCARRPASCSPRSTACPTTRPATR